MPEPINPQDHSLPDGMDQALMGHYGFALREAIHQTFERDARYAERVEAAAVKHAEWEAFVGHGDAGSFLGGKGKLREPMPRRRLQDIFTGRRSPGVFWEPGTPHRVSDPDTEIDRQARLIVDSEYRRRHAQSDAEAR